eukprot:m.186907 g.186907  ORF g.186907 m.186907 type:complete len:933 (+) comp18148_c0_seq2:670-3468(+)
MSDSKGMRPVSVIASLTLSSKPGSATAMAATEPIVAIPSVQLLHSWDPSATARQHFWFPPDKSKSESCGRCKSRFAPWDKEGLKCASCHVRVHQTCVGDSLPICRPTFSTGADNVVDSTPHHWIMGHFQQKKCIECNKTVRQALGGKDKSYRCAWCKSVVHKDCFDHLKHPFRKCEMGEFRSIILPASAIILGTDTRSRRIGGAVGEGRTVHSALSHTLEAGATRTVSLPPASVGSPLQRSHSSSDLQHTVAKAPGKPGFTITAPPGTSPLLVFINPKSGGNQGIKLLAQFMWWVNPRQVFNLMAPGEDGKPVGPRRGLELYKDVENLQLLVCGGDGTVGWVLETLDKMGLSEREIPVATLPLGTGNDLARELKWGGGYDGAPVHRILTKLITSTTTKMDRWQISVTPGPQTSASDVDDEDVPVQDQPPQGVLNNYFSIGSDAYTTLKFHMKREAKPKDHENSRLGNKLTYGLYGARDMIRHKFKHLSTELTLVCDGVDYTQLLRSKGIEAVAFLNISSYAAGTRPWGTKSSTNRFAAPALHDKKLEVVGFQSAWEMAKGQIGVGHALRICQCSKAVLVTKKPLPVQIDGEPCMLTSSTIEITHKNQATMLCRPKGRFKTKGGDPVFSDSDDDDDAFSHPIEPIEDVGTDAEAVAEAVLAAAVGASVSSENDDQVDVYYVPMDFSSEAADNASPFSQSSTTTCRSGVFKKLGAVTAKLDATLAASRGILEATLRVPFDHAAGWRYLAFCKSANPTQPGYFTVVTREEESIVQIRAFARPLSDVRPGLFICQLDAAPAPESVDDGFLEAVAEGSIEKAVKYIEMHANVNATDEGGRSALHLAAASDNPMLLSELLQHMQPSPVDYNGRTPLHVAALNGHESCCQILIDNGADSRCSDRQGQRPLDLALHAQFPSIVKMLAREENKQPDLETIV